MCAIFVGGAFSMSWQFKIAIDQSIDILCDSDNDMTNKNEDEEYRHGDYSHNSDSNES